MGHTPRPWLGLLLGGTVLAAGALDRGQEVLASHVEARGPWLVAQLGDGPEPPPGGGPAGLAGRTWRLTRLVRGGKEVALVPGSAPTIQFEQGGRVSGQASINRFSGSYAVDGAGALRWGRPGFATTLMAGPPELMEQERVFLEALGQASRLRMEGDVLVLEDGEQTTVLRFGR